MKLLLDTCALLDWVNGRLPGKARRQIQRSTADILVSIVTPWEIAIKHIHSGRFPLPSPERLNEALTVMGGRWLPITLSHTSRLFSLPLHHSDPFDRMIIVQALEEECRVVTRDQSFHLYRDAGLQVLWE
jgi:PIN domain nuclease of toxin-antitoxin system